MLKFTLDTNCIIDIDEGGSRAAAIRKLADAHALGTADVAIVAVTASERQPDKSYLTDYRLFQNRIHHLGLGHLGVVYGLFYFDICFFEACLWGDEEDIELEKLIHNTLFPTIPFLWTDFAKERNLTPQSIIEDEGKQWRNAWCDRQMFWAHQKSRRDVFVTSDKNYSRRLTKTPQFSAARVMSPDEAVALING